MTTALPITTDNLRKAAVLVRSLDPDAVATLLSRMPAADARAVRQAVRELDHVTEEERRLIAKELRAGAGSGVEGVEVCLTHQPDETPPVSPVPNTPPGPLNRLSEADAETLVAFLRVEQPATVAVVLSCLPPARAGEVLDGLPESLQRSAIDRLGELGDIDPDSLNVITAELEAWIARHTQDRKRQADRQALIQSILRASSASTRSRFEPELPAPVRPPAPTPSVPAAVDEQPAAPAAAPPKAPFRLPFAHLPTLPLPVLAEVLRQIDAPTLIVALVGADDTLMSHLRTISGRRQFRGLEQRIAAVGPLRLSDIQHARQLVEEAAGRVVQAKGAA